MLVEDKRRDILKWSKEETNIKHMLPLVFPNATTITSALNMADVLRKIVELAVPPANMVWYSYWCSQHHLFREYMLLTFAQLLNVS